MTEKRKADHLRICLEQEVETGSTWFEHVHFVHRALPTCDFDQIDTQVEFLGKRLDLPLIIAAITGGTPEAQRINRILAEAAQAEGIGMGVGSQRAMIENHALAQTYAVRDTAPDILLLGNIGISHADRIDEIKWAVDQIGADGLCVHINAAQELFQPEGDTALSKGLERIAALCRELKKPIVAKEVGNGISKEIARALADAGVAAIDVGGYGGTNWIVIDALRGGRDAAEYVGWGIPTAAAVIECRGKKPLIATGGIRSGLDIAKAIALGADVCGIALPFLKMAVKGGVEEVRRYIQRLRFEFKAALYLTGCDRVAKLREIPYVLSGPLLNWVRQRGLE